MKFSLFLLLALPVSAQTLFPDPLRNVVDGQREAIRLRMEIDAQRRQADVQKAEADLLRAQTERQRIENQRAQQEAEVSASPPSPEAAPNERDSANFNAIWKSTEGRFSDLSKFRPEMVRILGLIRTNDLSTSQHIEMLYLLAKYATFSRSSFATALPTPEPPKLDLPAFDLKPEPKAGKP